MCTGDVSIVCVMGGAQRFTISILITISQPEARCPSVCCDLSQGQGTTFSMLSLCKYGQTFPTAVCELTEGTSAPSRPTCNTSIHMQHARNHRALPPLLPTLQKTTRSSPSSCHLGQKTIQYQQHSWYRRSKFDSIAAPDFGHSAIQLLVFYSTTRRDTAR